MDPTLGDGFDTYGDSSSMSGGGSSIWAGLFAGAASVANTAILAGANPINAAIATNTPISTPMLSTGYSGNTLAAAAPSGNMLMLIVLAVLAFLAFSALSHK